MRIALHSVRFSTSTIRIPEPLELLGDADAGLTERESADQAPKYFSAAANASSGVMSPAKPSRACPGTKNCLWERDHVLTWNLITDAGVPSGGCAYGCARIPLAEKRAGCRGSCRRNMHAKIGQKLSRCVRFLPRQTWMQNDVRKRIHGQVENPSLPTVVWRIVVASRPASPFSEPPTKSMASAICCALRLSVPWSNKSAVREATPGLSAGSRVVPASRISNSTATAG